MPYLPLPHTTQSTIIYRVSSQGRSAPLSFLHYYSIIYYYIPCSPYKNKCVIMRCFSDKPLPIKQMTYRLLWSPHHPHPRALILLSAGVLYKQFLVQVEVAMVCHCCALPLYLHPTPYYCSYKCPPFPPANKFMP